MRLADVDADLLRELSDEERAEAKRLSLPVWELGDGSFDLGAELGREGAFAAIVIDGLLRQQVRLGGQVALRLLGPGEIIAVGEAPRPMLLFAEWYAVAGTRVAVLGDEFLLASRRWPRLHASLEARIADQIERLSAQLVICQLPRVEDRLLAMLWLLAETWGRVTAAGTTLPLSLTHETLGSLVGARRSTVTLALGELTESGMLVHQDRGWLLLERPALPDGEGTELEAPLVLDQEPSDWTVDLEQARQAAQHGAALRDTVHALRGQYLRNTEQVRARLRRANLSQGAARQLRERIQEQRRVRRRQPPSS
jgi:hypothetical protein